MKYYKLTCIKDTPNVEKGFSYTVSEENLTDQHYSIFVDDYNTVEGEKKNNKINELISLYQTGKTDFVKTEIDLDRAIPQILCPKCHKASLFTYVCPEDRTYDDGVSSYYKRVGLECGFCDYTQELMNVHTRIKIQ